MRPVADASRTEDARREAPAPLAAALLLLLAVPAGLALSQPAGGEKRPPRPPVDVVLDANDDGVIDAGEIRNASVALKKLDANGDGKLTPDELRPKRSDGPAGPGAKAPSPSQDPGPPQGEKGRRRPLPPIVSALDTSGDGTLDAGEVANAPKALLKLDANGDGRLAPEEYRPPRPEGGPPPSGKQPERRTP